MIFSAEPLRALHARKPVAARERLVRLLTCYQDATGVHVVCVFDGKGTRTASPEEENPIQVFYSADARTADAVIERLAAKYADVYDVTVATADRQEAQTVISFGAAWISCEQLGTRMREAEENLQNRLRDLRRKPPSN